MVAAYYLGMPTSNRRTGYVPFAQQLELLMPVPIIEKQGPPTGGGLQRKGGKDNTPISAARASAMRARKNLAMRANAKLASSFLNPAVLVRLSASRYWGKRSGNQNFQNVPESSGWGGIYLNRKRRTGRARVAR